jgi:hypothetical protein
MTSTSVFLPRLVALALVLCVTGCGEPDSPQEREIPVAQAERRDIRAEIRLSGDIAPAFQVEIKPEAGGKLREAEAHGNLTARLALLEEAKSLPWGAVWDEFCRRSNVPVGAAWLAEAEAYGQETTRLGS